MADLEATYSGLRDAHAAAELASIQTMQEIQALREALHVDQQQRRMAEESLIQSKRMLQSMCDEVETLTMRLATYERERMLSEQAIRHLQQQRETEMQITEKLDRELCNSRLEYEQVAQDLKRNVTDLADNREEASRLNALLDAATTKQ